MARRNQKLVPGCEKAIDQMKYEIAAELGLMGTSQAGSSDVEFASELGSAGGGYVDWANLPSRYAGAVGGSITQRLVQIAQQQTMQS
jgi:hypothetical protein